MNTVVKEGDILAFRSVDSPNMKKFDKMYMKLIRLGNYLEFGKEGWTDSIHHVSIIGGFENDQHGDRCAIVYEAIGTGVISSLYPVWWINKSVDEGSMVVLRPRQQIHTIDKFAEQYKGIPYDWMSIIALGVLILTQKKIPFFEKFKGPQTQFCSEFVLRVLYDASDKNINLEKEFEKDFDRLMPMHLFYSDQFKAMF